MIEIDWNLVLSALAASAAPLSLYLALQQRNLARRQAPNAGIGIGASFTGEVTVVGDQRIRTYTLSIDVEGAGQYNQVTMWLICPGGFKHLGEEVELTASNGHWSHKEHLADIKDVHFLVTWLDTGRAAPLHQAARVTLDDSQHIEIWKWRLGHILIHAFQTSRPFRWLADHRIDLTRPLGRWKKSKSNPNLPKELPGWPVCKPLRKQR